MSRIVKLCGLRRPEDVEAALRAGADELGFIFHPPSQRNLSLEDAALLRAFIPPQRRAIAVMVNPSDETVDEILRRFQPEALQLHGEETPERVAELRLRAGRPVIKAIAVKTADDITAASMYEAVADALLFDTKAPGGTSGGFG